ncbi:uncharacterized protein BT62DRAFT_989937 [Guyanagaster necrorhizus]|uniref:Zn(2)-C6 fungal-type domain-containing protein n=1 Tax=Guyanagaster necrorhizus TaxID=856835 RepID=A0A9P7W6M6_9AGAR|nr:uncharacterized protein BT62DRAFT_989937 [Guyanagaster necrorhizus MCA 3950]KAG7452925.1 hypothetical protein BT62DRAFT_989937 [Guyanagaster necrorhizus MCA 3950]
MAPIRPHHKTRSGCKTCKQRKVKCDEGLPVCKNCTRRGMECAWNNTSTTHESTALERSTVAKESSFLKEGSPLTVSKWTGPGPSDLLKLELMHHYATSASHSLSSDPDASRVWRNIVPKMAFVPQNQCLLHAILAFSALHIHRVDSTSPFVERYATAASSFYHQAKFDLHTADMQESADINAVLIALSLVARYEFAASAEVFPRSGDWYTTIHAIRRNIAKNRTQLQDNVLRLFLSALAPSLQPTHVEEQFPLSLSTILSTTDPVPDVDELSDVSVRTAYEDSIYWLELAWTAPFNRWMCVWWYMMPTTFFRLLAEERPRALIILAHYCAMMNRVAKDGPWWVKKQWGNEVARIVSMLDTQWAPWLGWLSSQLDQVHDSQAVDFTSVDFLNWFNGPSTQEMVIGQTFPTFHRATER